MSEVIDATTGEVLQVAETTLAKVGNQVGNLDHLVKEQDRPLLAIMENATLDWHALKPNQTAVLLTLKPFSVSGGGTSYLNFRQALYFAVRCYELGVSPFSTAVWFDPARFSVNLTLEGKRELARNRNIDLGPPMFEEIYREWKDLPKVSENGEAAKKAGFAKDVGIVCKMRVGDPKNNEHVSFTAWLNDWYVGRSPVWQSKPMHMLTVRANEKALTLILGTGVSAMPDGGPDGE